MLRFSRSDDPIEEKKPRIVDGAGAKAWLGAMAQPGSIANLLEIAEVLSALGARGEESGAPALHPQRKFAIAERIRGVLVHVLLERGREDPFVSLPLSDEFSLRFWPAIDAAAALRDVYAWLVSQLPEGPTASSGAQPTADQAAANVTTMTRVDALQRALDVNAQAMLVIQRARWPVPASMWERHCTLGQLVRDLDCQDIEVADAQHTSTTRTCRSAFVLPIMVALADPASRNAAEFDVTRMAAQRWSKKVGFRIERRADVNNAPARPVPNPGPSVVLGNFQLRFDTQSAIQSIDKRLEALGEGKSPREVGIGDSLRPQAARDLLLSLRQRWGSVAPPDIAAPDRAWRNAPPDTQVLAIIGMPTREGALRETDPNAASQFGRQNTYAYQRMKRGDITRPRAVIEGERLEHLLGGAEPWALSAESPDAVRCVRKHARPRIGLHRLVGLKLGARESDAPFLLGWVEALQGTTSEDDDGRIRHTAAHWIRVRLARGIPQVVRASVDETELECAFLLSPGVNGTRPGTRSHTTNAGAFVPMRSDSGLQPNAMQKRDGDGWQAVRASPREFGLVLPHATFRPQRLVRAVHDGVLAVLRLEELMMRGADFDLVRFTPL
jgi:hypothetical protein